MAWVHPVRSMQANSVAAIIIDELKDAFPARRIIPFPSFVNGTFRDERSQSEIDFREKDDWTKLEPEWLDKVPLGLGTALSFLSDETVCFAIPAFIAADLVGGLQRANPAFSLTHGFDDASLGRRINPKAARTWTDYSRARWSRLTVEQVMVVVHYLEWKVERGGFTFEHDIVEALRNYWYRRASGA